LLSLNEQLRESERQPEVELDGIVLVAEFGELVNVAGLAAMEADVANPNRSVIGVQIFK
jgi:hypothetical protein